MQIRDRIVELRRVRADQLLPNPKNWRTHSDAQRDAMRGILAEVGYAGAALAYETKAGLQLIDGHLRAETTPEALIPVLILDVTEKEAEKILATYDPLAAMAGADATKLAALQARIKTNSDALREMLGAVAVAAGLVDPPDAPEDFPTVDETIPVNCQCPKCGYEWSDGN